MSGYEPEPGQFSDDDLGKKRHFYLWLTSGGGLDMEGVMIELNNSFERYGNVVAIVSLVQDGLVAMDAAYPNQLSITDLGNEKCKELGIPQKGPGHQSYLPPA